jgi:hypothetical protein
MIRTTCGFRQLKWDRAISLSVRGIVAKRVAKRNGKEAMKYKERISELEYQDRLENFLKGALNTNLQSLRSLETATKKRRAQKKKAATDSGITQSTKTTSG